MEPVVLEEEEEEEEAEVGNVLAVLAVCNC